MHKRNMLYIKSNLINSQCSIETMPTVNEFIVFREREDMEGRRQLKALLFHLDVSLSSPCSLKLYGTSKAT